MEYDPQDIATIRQRALEVPLGGESGLLSETASSAVLEDLVRAGSIIPEHLKQQTELLTDELEEKTEGKIPRDILRGIVARVSIASSTQTVVDIGQGLFDMNSLYEALGLKSQLVATADEPPAA